MALTERTPSGIIYVDSNGVSHNVKAVYKGSKKVRPEGGGGGWTPGANTVMYYPLTSITTVEDQSGNGYDLTNNSNLVTFGTNAGVDCANFGTPGQGNHNLYYTNPTFLPSGNADRTMSIWAYNTRTSKHDSLMCFWGEWSSGKLYGFFFNDGVYIATYGGDTSQHAFTTNTRHNVIGTYTQGSLCLYLDGVLLQNASISNRTTTTPKFGIGGGSTSYWGGNHYRDGYLSECIVENVVRTAQEVADYYDLTKGNYGIS